jgi:hypothetical protein
MRKLPLDNLVQMLKRLPGVAEERRIMARALRQVRSMNPRVAKLLVQQDRARRAKLASRWMEEVAES